MGVSYGCLSSNCAPEKVMTVASDLKHILVVEDDATLGQVIRFKLAKGGYAVQLAPHGQAAFIMLGETDYDLIVTDEVMPLVTGRQLCERMQKHPVYSRIPVVMLTVKALELDPVELREHLGVVELHPKPFSPTLLLRTIQRVLANHRGTGAAPADETFAR